jgi:Putative inner membrane protein (DUF1819)
MTCELYDVNLAKGQGMIPETVLLLNIWQPGVSALELRNKVVANGVLSKATAYRASDIVTRVFARRYVDETGSPAKWLKRLLDGGWQGDRLSQLLLIYTARENLILRDFINDVYWPHYRAGASLIHRQEGMNFLKSAWSAGRLRNRWSDAMQAKVVRYLFAALTDFRMLRDLPKKRREILPFTVLPTTTAYLAHELHFEGLSDSKLINHPDWALFGLDQYAVLQELRKISPHLIVQSAGDLVRITWTYKSVEDFIDAISLG